MVDITFIRNAGDREGQTIQNVLISEDGVAFEKGREFLDDNAQESIPFDVEVVYDSRFKPGVLVELIALGKTHICKVLEVQHTEKSSVIITKLKVLAGT